MAIQTPPIKIFIAYSRLDADYLKELQKYLRPLNRKKTIEIWYDGEIIPGTKWAVEINQHLNAADIILLLITANSLSSDYFYNEEMQKALQRHEKGEAKVIPVILRYCTWRLFDELSELQALPKDGIPLSHWSDDAEAYTNVVEELHRVVVGIRAVKIKRAKPSIEEKKDETMQPQEKTPTKVLQRPTPKIIKNPEYPLQIQKILQDMVLVEGGTFMMGSEKGHDDEKPVHKVTVPTFQIGKYPVTQAQWQAVMGNNPSRFIGCEDCPVETVSWDDAKEFIEKLNELTGKKFRLPSEAEWEFAARGGIKSKGFEYAGSNDVEEVAWYGNNSDGKTHLVGEKKANELGLYDMSGNVWEWCEDDWHSSYESAPSDGMAWKAQPRTDRRLVRGGSCGHDNYFCRVVFRGSGDAYSRYSHFGLRLALPQF